MFETVLLLACVSSRSEQNKIFLTLPNLEHIVVIDVVSFSDIQASWPTSIRSVSNQLLNDIYFEISPQFFCRCHKW